MTIYARFAAIVLVIGLAVLGTGGRWLFPVHATTTSTIRCSPLFKARPGAGIHAEELAYEQLRDGCVPLPGTMAQNPLVHALGQEAHLSTAHAIGGAWSSLGPSPIDASADQVFPRDSGRITALAYDAGLNGGTLFAAAAAGGVWESTNGGSSWAVLTDGMPSLAMGALAVDPNNANVIYAGTGEPNGGDALYGVGIYKSTNGGQSWTNYGSTFFQDQSISAIVVDPGNSSRLYAAARYSGGSGGYVPQNTIIGVAVSTDGGQTWSTPATSQLTNDQDTVSDLTVDNNGNLYAAVLASAVNGAAEQGVWLSTDHGNTWTQINGATIPTDGNDYKLVLATPKQPLGQQILYAMVGNGGLEGIYVSQNAGAEAANPAGTTSWTQIAQSTDVEADEAQSDYDMDIAVDPKNTATVYFGLSSVYRITNALTTPTVTDLAYGYCVFSGSTTTCPPTWNPRAGAIHVDQHAIAITPNGTGEMAYFGSDGGVYKWDTTTYIPGTSSPPEPNWQDANGTTPNALTTSQFYDGVTGGAASPNVLVGGMQDNGSAIATSTTGRSLWTEIQGGDGFYTAVDPTTTVDPVNGTGTVYDEYTYGYVYQSTLGGPGQQPFINGFPAADASGSIDGALFSAPLAMDPQNPNILYSAHTHLWRIDASAGTPTWQNISANLNPAPCSGLSGLAVGNTIPGGTRSTVYIGDTCGNTWVTTTPGAGTPTWRSLNSNNCATTIAPNCATITDGFGNTLFQPGITSMVVDPTNANIVYATLNSFQGAQQNHVFRGQYNPSNGAISWQDISTTLPDEPFQSVAVNPNTPTTIYAGSETNVYVSTDSGTSWTTLGTNYPHAAAFSLTISSDGNTLYAFTHGRGVFKIGIGAAGPSVTIGKGWNLIDLPIVPSSSTPAIATAADLISNLNANSASPGTIAAVATYSLGRFRLYVPTYSPALTVSDAQGIFVLRTTTGMQTWTPPGTGYSTGQLTVPLSRGWNLAGAPFPSGGLTGTALDTQLGTTSNCNMQETATYNGSSYTVHMYNNTTDGFQVPPTAGMWILCTQPFNWQPH